MSRKVQLTTVLCKRLSGRPCSIGSVCRVCAGDEGTPAVLWCQAVAMGSGSVDADVSGQEHCTCVPETIIPPDAVAFHDST